MAVASPSSPRPLGDALPVVRLEVCVGGTSTTYPVGETGFLLGSVPGCDLRLPGVGLPPVLALVSRQPDHIRLRKLAPIGILLLNGDSVTDSLLNDGDRLTIGTLDITVHISSIPVMRVRLFEAKPEDVREEPELAERERRLEEERQELERLRQELTDIRQQLYQRYRQRRDRLAGQQEALRKATRRLQEKQQALEQRPPEDDPVRGNADLAGREKKLEEERQALTRSQTQHQTDLVRLDRLAALLDQRQRQMQRSALEIDRRYETLQRDTRELEEQASQLDEWRSRLHSEDEERNRQRKEMDAARSELAARSAALEGQQAMLASLRSRMEKLREEQRRREQQLDEQRMRQDAAEAEIQQRLSESRRLTLELQADSQLRGQQQKQIDERRATLEAAVTQLRQAQEKLAEETRRFEESRQEQEDRSARHAEQEALLEAQTRAVEEERERLRLDRQALDERQAAHGRGEQGLAALQEQLRKRNDELAERQRRLDEQVKAHQEEKTAFDSARAGQQTQHAEQQQQWEQVRQRLEQEKAELATLRTDLEQREAALRVEVQELIETKERLGSWRSTEEEARASLLAERNRVMAETEAARAGMEMVRQELPNLEAQATAALERLALAREQLREHLAELHSYVKQGRADLEGLRNGVGQEQQRLREQEQQLNQARDQHRLAVADFRQQLSEWQGQLAELKRGLAQGEDRLEKRLAEVEERSRAITATSQQLAQQAEQLEQQERQVVERRQEVDRHLVDMREWYRKKLREVSGIDADPASGGRESSVIPTGDSRPPLATPRNTEPGDKQLGELLRSLELIDAETLTALLDGARRQRRSLRQLLLQGGYLTLFQMALIEAGNLDGLVLGPVRVIDRLHTTAHEAAYRVFDPRRECECLLRILDEDELQDAVRPDEFRQRFAAAVEVTHPNLAATYEVLEIAGRPAVLQEWLNGLCSSDWPALSAVPGVWFRLVSQAALGLHTAHQAGLVHGHLHPAQVVVTAEGMLKVCGLGEPAWLDHALEESDLPHGAILAEPTPADDLLALGHCGLAWSMPSGETKGGKAKPLPESLHVLLRRLCREEGEAFSSAQALLNELDAAGTSVPANAAAWERFVKHVREQAANTPLRRSA